MATIIGNTGYQIMFYKRMLQFSIYPITISVAVFLHWWLTRSGYPLIITTYLPVICAALFIHVLEQLNPYQIHWLPSKADFIQDSLYMVMVQVLLPKAMSFAMAIYLVAWLNVNGSIWPVEENVFLQAGLMLLCADFFRYWLHRGYHESIFMWRFHAIHHSPQKLYWLNVGRFHFTDKTTQYLFEMLPFILLGVSEEVLALYFVFYAINGFFQHCNIDIRLGWLNYLISGPELHRWHHSIKVKESNNNYGNNLIIWDLLFGTYFLPRERSVKKLGLLNRLYPTSFLAQIKAPFIDNLDKYNKEK